MFVITASGPAKNKISSVANLPPKLIRWRWLEPDSVSSHTAPLVDFDDK